MIVCHLPHGPTAYFNIDQVVMRHEVKDIGKISEEYPQLVFEGITSKLGERVSNLRSHTCSLHIIMDLNYSKISKLF